MAPLSLSNEPFNITAPGDCLSDRFSRGDIYEGVLNMSTAELMLPRIC